MISSSQLFANVQLAEASYANLAGLRVGSAAADEQQVRARLVSEGFNK